MYAHRSPTVESRIFSVNKGSWSLAERSRNTAKRCRYRPSIFANRRDGVLAIPACLAVSAWYEICICEHRAAATAQWVLVCTIHSVGEEKLHESARHRTSSRDHASDPRL